MYHLNALASDRCPSPHDEDGFLGAATLLQHVLPGLVASQQGKEEQSRGSLGVGIANICQLRSTSVFVRRKDRVWIRRGRRTGPIVCIPPK